MDRWYPVARSEEAVPRHVVECRVLGQDLAVWRDVAGGINAWANRCPHRGVRLSIGFNTGQELRCQYHGWRFATGSGQCRLIPSHPTQKPASTMHATLYGVAERYGFIWVRLAGADGGPPDLPGVARSPAGPATTLRSLFMRAPADAIASALRRGYALDAVAEQPTPVVAHDSWTFRVGTGGRTDLVFLLQPVSQQETIVHGLLLARIAPSDRLPVLRHHNAQLTALRNAIQSAG